MELITMSERDLQRIEVLSKVAAGRMTMVSAAHVLDLSTRQVCRLLERIRTCGAASIRHKAIGRPSNNRISDSVWSYAMALIQECYADFGPTLASEMLAERDGLSVSRETVRSWMVDAGLWLSRRQRRTFHQPRLRREAYGELVQIDGSDHRWFEDRGDPCSLLVFIDDATGKLMQLRFVRSESAFTYFEALELYLTRHGAPIAFYSDKHSVFRVAKKDARGGQAMTQFGRALCELNIEILCANSSQAKGRVERMNRTLQDRLVKALRLARIDDMEAGNAFLSNFMDRYNARFSVVPARPEDLHRPLNLAPNRLAEILCKREQRYVGAQLSFSFERKRIILEETEVMPVRLVVVTDAHMQAFGKRTGQRVVGENSDDLFDADHAKRLLELAAAETNARCVVIDYRSGNVADAIDKLVYIAAFLISGRSTLAKDEMRKVLRSIENLD